VSTFDVVAHCRARTVAAERRAEHLERRRVQLERLLAVCLDVAVGGSRVDRLALLSLLEDMLAQLDEIRALPSTDTLVTLLRETDPDHRGRS
jgi:hypothetical protein